MKIWYRNRQHNVSVHVDKNSPVFGYLIPRLDTTNQRSHKVTNDVILELLTLLDMFIVYGHDRIALPELNDQGEANPLYGTLDENEAFYYKKQFKRLAPYCSFVPYFKVDEI